MPKSKKSDAGGKKKDDEGVETRTRSKKQRPTPYQQSPKRVTFDTNLIQGPSTEVNNSPSTSKRSTKNSVASSTIPKSSQPQKSKPATSSPQSTQKESQNNQQKRQLYHQGPRRITFDFKLTKDSPQEVNNNPSTSSKTNSAAGSSTIPKNQQPQRVQQRSRQPTAFPRMMTQQEFNKYMAVKAAAAASKKPPVIPTPPKEIDCVRCTSLEEAVTKITNVLHDTKKDSTLILQFREDPTNGCLYVHISAQLDDEGDGKRKRLMRKQVAKDPIVLGPNDKLHFNWDHSF